MKNFLFLLLKGIGIALAVSLTVCFFASYWGNWRAVIWYVVGLLAVWQVCKYLRSEVKVYDYCNDKIVEHNASLREKIDELEIELFFISIAVGFFWCIGKFVEWIFNASASIFEYTVFKGFIASLIIFVCFETISLTYNANKELNWKLFKSSVSEIVLWLIVLVISSAVGIAVFYYFFPC